MVRFHSGEFRPAREQLFIICWLRMLIAIPAYVSQQNLLSDDENGPVGHPDIEDVSPALKKADIAKAEAFN